MCGYFGGGVLIFLLLNNNFYDRDQALGKHERGKFIDFGLWPLTYCIRIELRIKR